MRVSFKHHSNPEIVRGKLEEAIGKALDVGGGQITQLNYAWSGDSLEFSFAVISKTVKGSADVTETDIVVEAGVPMMFRPFEGKVKSRILGALNEMFP
jgi:hypothetical protein